ncbi:MAG: hypothetical protein A3D52_00295 [Candidatus Taylorbacteria bacterium RIFCSPHIGHO2_02_FULL_44_36]|nr:MAG: hypothetical protein A3D52_00295 [Candidatus Taylorbacteria bacterium RIFCSPHIGHO2_02_FULL_44_36]HXK40643.1 hypothetical protein [Candidatus Paceibacterota bacterium]
MTKLKKLRLIEFLVIGIVMGLAEDLLAIFFATDAEITPRVVFVVLAVAIPFAFISEIVVDHPRFWQKVLPFVKDKNNNQIK